MRVVSWNLGYGFAYKATHDRAWHYLAALDPDIALLQEAHPPEWAREHWTIVMQPIRNWGSAVVAKRNLQLAPYPCLSDSQLERDAYLATATLTLADGTPLLIASVHTPIGAASPEDYAGLDPEAIKRPREAVPYHNDVAYAIYRDRVAGRRFVVSGDWNVARLWDVHHPGANEADFFARSEADGWVECYRRLHPEAEGRSWFRDQDPHYQLDHAFCDPATAAFLEASDIDAHPAEVLKLSDHAPMILEFTP